MELKMTSETPASPSPSDAELLAKEEAFRASEAMNNLVGAIREGMQTTYNSRLKEIIKEFQVFLKERPAPPLEWLDRVGAQADKFDYHQIVLPDCLCDPYCEEESNMELLLEQYSDTSFMALEHFLMTRNRFLYQDGHAISGYCPKPLLMLENYPENQDPDYDCYLYLFPDGSYISYSLDNDEEEFLGQDSLALLGSIGKILSRLRIVFPVEGRDYGILEE